MSQTNTNSLQAGHFMDKSRETCSSRATFSDTNTFASTPTSVCKPTFNAAIKRNRKVSAVLTRQVEHQKKEALSAAISPDAAGRRGALWVEQWDGGSRVIRLRILEAFRTLHSSSNINGIEEDLGDSSVLFFTRITAWFRLTCKLNYELRLILVAISLFVRGVRYLTYFVEIGGLQTLIDTLATCMLVVEDRREILLLLRHVANAGRTYREMLCDDNGVTLLLQVMQREDNSEILDQLAALFFVLGERGNRSLSARVQNGLVGLLLAEGISAEAGLHVARTLRTFQLSRDRVYAETIAGDMLGDDGTVPIVGMGADSSPEDAQSLLKALFSLLYHDDLRLRVEGTELLTMVAKNIQFTGPILIRCFDVVDEDCLAIEDEDNLDAALVVRRHQISFGSTAVNIMLIDSNCEARKRIMLDITARRSAHFTLLKYMRLLECGYTTFVVDCCRVLQVLCREALAQKRRSPESKSDRSVLSLEKAADYILGVVGETLYNTLLYEELTGDEVVSIARTVASSDLHM